MHIPDGYLGPKTYLPLWLVAFVIWVFCFFRVRKEGKTEHLLLAGIFSAFSFVLQMFNIPLPGGTSAHICGAGLIAIILGPSLATVALSLVLVIQALLFADGGITAIGANVFNMAFLFPLSSWFIFRISGSAFLSGYTGINIASLATAIEIGLQPVLERSPDGQPLYSPYSINIALPAMLIPHLLIVGVIEGLFTALFIKYLRRNYPEVFK